MYDLSDFITERVLYLSRVHETADEIWWNEILVVHLRRAEFLSVARDEHPAKAVDNYLSLIPSGSLRIREGLSPSDSSCIPGDELKEIKFFKDFWGISARQIIVVCSLLYYVQLNGNYFEDCPRLAHIFDYCLEIRSKFTGSVCRTHLTNSKKRFINLAGLTGIDSRIIRISSFVSSAGIRQRGTKILLEYQERLISVISESGEFSDNCALVIQDMLMAIAHSIKSSMPTGLYMCLDIFTNFIKKFGNSEAFRRFLVLLPKIRGDISSSGKTDYRIWSAFFGAFSTVFSYVGTNRKNLGAMIALRSPQESEQNLNLVLQMTDIRDFFSERIKSECIDIDSMDVWYCVYYSEMIKSYMNTLCFLSDRDEIHNLAEHLIGIAQKLVVIDNVVKAGIFLSILESLVIIIDLCEGNDLLRRIYKIAAHAVRSFGEYLSLDVLPDKCKFSIIVNVMLIISKSKLQIPIFNYGYLEQSIGFVPSRGDDFKAHVSQVVLELFLNKGSQLRLTSAFSKLLELIHCKNFPNGRATLKMLAAVVFVALPKDKFSMVCENLISNLNDFCEYTPVVLSATGCSNHNIIAMYAKTIYLMVNKFKVSWKLSWNRKDKNERQTQMDELERVIKYCNFSISILAESNDQIGEFEGMIKQSANIIYIFAILLFVLPTGRWNPKYRDLMYELSSLMYTCRTRTKIKHPGTQPLDQIIQNIFGDETLDVHTNTLYCLKGILKSLLHGAPSVYEEISGLSLYSVIKLIKLNFFGECCIMKGFSETRMSLFLPEVVGGNPGYEMVVDAIVTKLLKICTYVLKNFDNAKDIFWVYLTNLVYKFFLSVDTSNHSFANRITGILQTIPLLYLSNKSLFLVLDVLCINNINSKLVTATYLRDISFEHVPRKIKMMSLKSSDNKKSVLKLLVRNWINGGSKIFLRGMHNLLQRYIINYRDGLSNGYSMIYIREFLNILIAMEVNPDLLDMLLVESAGAQCVSKVTKEIMPNRESNFGSPTPPHHQDCFQLESDSRNNVGLVGYNVNDLEAVLEEEILYLFSMDCDIDEKKSRICKFFGLARVIVMQGCNNFNIIKSIALTPITCFTKNVVDLFVALYKEIIKFNPSYQDAVISGAIELWKYTITYEFGIYGPVGKNANRSSMLTNPNLRRYNNFLAEESSFPHTALLEFLLENFQDSSFRSDATMKLYSDLVSSSIANISKNISDSMCRNVQMNLIILAISLIKVTDLGSFWSSLLFVKDIMNAILNMYNIDTFPSFLEKEFLETTITLYEALNDLDIERLAKSSERSAKPVLMGDKCKSLRLTEIMNLKNLSILFIMCEVYHKKIRLNPLGCIYMDLPSPATFISEIKDFSKIILTTLSTNNPGLSLSIKSLVGNFSCNYGSILSNLCMQLPYHMVENKNFADFVIQESVNNNIKGNNRAIFYCTHLSPIKILYWLNIVSSKEVYIIQYLLNMLHMLSVQDLLFYTQQIVQTIINDTTAILEDSIISLVKKSKYFLHKVIWTLDASMDYASIGNANIARLKTIKNKIISKLTKMEMILYKTEFGFIDKITDISRRLSSLAETKKSKAVLKEHINLELAKIQIPSTTYLPTNPENIILEIDHTSGKPMPSHSKVPFMVTFKVAQYPKAPTNDPGKKIYYTPEPVRVSSIFKSGDDCRQDILALQLIAIFKKIFDTEGVDVYVHPYSVVATGPKCGIIEVIPNSMSRDAIGREKVNSLHDWFVAEFRRRGSQRYMEACKEFTRSMAAYSVILFLLQVKDRHNGNIMIDRQGHVIHIDFGFILSIAPGGGFLENSPFKLTPEMAKLMGCDEDSHLYTSYKELCVKAFLASRVHAEEIINTVYIMLNSKLPCLKGEGTIKKLRERFMLNVTDQKAAEFMLNCIKTSHSNTGNHLYDTFQYLQNGISY